MIVNVKKTVYLGFISVFYNGFNTKGIHFQGDFYSQNVINEIKEIKNNKETIYLFINDSIQDFDGFKVEDLIHSFYRGFEIILAVSFCNTRKDKKDVKSLSSEEFRYYLAELNCFRKLISERLNEIKDKFDYTFFGEMK